MVIVEEGKKVQTKTDLQYEGKDQVYLDIDRIINEGLSGGSVHSRHDTTNIEGEVVRGSITTTLRHRYL
jgi:hypothetical protein